MAHGHWNWCSVQLLPYYDIYEHNIHNFWYKKSQIKTQAKKGCWRVCVGRVVILVDYMGYKIIEY